LATAFHDELLALIKGKVDPDVYNTLKRTQKAQAGVVFGEPAPVPSMRELAREFVCLKDVISDCSSGIHPLSIGLIRHTDDDQDSESSKSSKKPLKAKSQCRPESNLHQKDDEDDRDGQKDPKPRHNFGSGKDAHSPTYHGSDKAKTDDDIYGSPINPTSDHDADASIQSFDSAVFGLGGSIPSPKKPEMEYFPELDILHEAL
jgi:hypothetical protein